MRKGASVRAGFSLIELLVVIGIIAILISILLPTLAAARRQANLLKCSANMRQVYQGAMLHMQEHGGYLPLAGNLTIQSPTIAGAEQIASMLEDRTRKRYTYSWTPGYAHVPAPLPAAVAQYLGWRNLSFDNWNILDQELNNLRGVWQMFICPETDAMDRGRASADPNDTTPTIQGMMMVLTQTSWISHSWSTNSDFGINEGIFGFDYRKQYKSRRLAGKLSHVQRQSETVLFCDAKLNVADPAILSHLPHPWITLAPALDSVGPVTLADVLAQNSKVTPYRAGIDKLRHKRRMNICFADGHVETVHISDKSLAHAFLVSK